LGAISGFLKELPPNRSNRNSSQERQAVEQE